VEDEPNMDETPTGHENGVDHIEEEIPSTLNIETGEDEPNVDETPTEHENGVGHNAANIICTREEKVIDHSEEKIISALGVKVKEDDSGANEVLIEIISTSNTEIGESKVETKIVDTPSIEIGESKVETKIVSTPSIETVEDEPNMDETPTGHENGVGHKVSTEIICPKNVETKEGEYNSLSRMNLTLTAHECKAIEQFCRDDNRNRRDTSGPRPYMPSQFRSRFLVQFLHGKGRQLIIDGNGISLCNASGPLPSVLHRLGRRSSEQLLHVLGKRGEEPSGLPYVFLVGPKKEHKKGHVEKSNIGKRPQTSRGANTRSITDKKAHVSNPVHTE
jgi:hypothetical protein